MKKQPVFRVIPVRVTPVAAAVASALGSISGASLAAETEETVVTATRRDTSVQEVPYNLSAISGDTIESLQLTNLSDIARYTPGLIQFDQGARDANLLIMRGINASPSGAPELLRNTQGDRVATFYGETPVYIDLAPIDIERVEILRGPQGTLYGTRSMGGAIRYIPKAPELDAFTVDAHGRLYDMAESDDYGYDGDVVINMPLIEDTLALRAMLGYWDTPGFIDQPFLLRNPGVSCPEPFQDGPGCTPDDLRSKDDINDIETTSAGLSLLWKISDNFDATLSWRYQDQEIGGRQANTRDSLRYIITDSGDPLNTSKYDNGFRFEEPNDRENNIYNLELNYDAGSFTVLSTTSYSTYEDKGNRDQTDLLLSYGYGEFPAFAAFTVDQTDDDILTQEIRAVSKDSGSRWDWVVGGFYQEGDFEQNGLEISYGLGPAEEITAILGTDRETEEIAVFGELGYDINDRLHVSVGARWFDFDDDIVGCSEFPFFQPLTCTEGGGDDDDTLFKLGADYRFSDAVLGYALFSQGFSPGGVNPALFPDDLTDDERFVEPEEIDNYEVGVRSQWLDNNLTVNGAVFYMDWSDIQYDGVSSGGFNITRNGGEAETKGLELEATYALGEHWTFGAGYAYTNGELDSDCIVTDPFDPGVCPSSGTVESGDRLPGFPEHQGSAVVGYTNDLNAQMALNASWRMVTQSDVFTQLGDGDDCCRNDGEELGGFSVHYATLGVSTDTWDLTLFADNIFDKYAVTGVRDTRAQIGGDGSSNDLAVRRYFQNVLTPRTIGLDFRYRFRGQ
jgi:outer membrane receptor protein involved in Fe transport